MAVVTIDGPSGVGKSAVARALAYRLGYRYLSVGLVYRAFSWASLQNLDLSEQLLQDLSIKPIVDDQGITDPKVMYRDVDMNPQLYGNAQLDELCAALAQKPEVRLLAQRLVARYSPGHNLVLEGRTAHHAVEEPAIKFYLWADPRERSHRNQCEYERLGLGGQAAALAVTAQLRDEADLTRKVDPLRLEHDMIAWDSTYATMEETVAGIARVVQHHQGAQPLRVSVIIPARNRADHLDLCLRNLLTQTIPLEQYEVIVVDDGSSDGTAARAANRGVEVISIPPSGVCVARNRGLAVASGDIILFLDADMLVQPDFLQQHINLHTRANHLVVMGARRHLPPDTLTADPGVASSSFTRTGRHSSLGNGKRVIRRPGDHHP